MDNKTGYMFSYYVHWYCQGSLEREKRYALVYAVNRDEAIHVLRKKNNDNVHEVVDLTLGL
jgi:hypothetical protein